MSKQIQILSVTCKRVCCLHVHFSQCADSPRTAITQHVLCSESGRFRACVLLKSLFALNRSKDKYLQYWKHVSDLTSPLISCLSFRSQCGETLYLKLGGFSWLMMMVSVALTLTALIVILFYFTHTCTLSYIHCLKGAIQIHFIMTYFILLQLKF